MSAPLLPWQAEAVRWLLDPAAPPTLAINGGIGVGKSWVLAFALVATAVSRPGSKSALLSDSWPSIAGNNLPPLLDMAEGYAEWHGSERMFRFANGSTIELRHYRLTSGALESSNPIEGRNFNGLIVADEAQKLHPMVLDHALSRARGTVLDLNGHEWSPRVIMNGRPDAGDWWWERAVDEMGGVVLKPKTAENPHNGPDYLDNLRARYTPAMFRCVTEGVPAPPEGGVFESLAEAPPPEGNIIDGWQYNPHAAVELGIDFGRRTPAVVFIQRSTVDGEPVDVVFDELAPDGCTTPQLIGRILQPWQARWPGRSSLYGQPKSAWRVDTAYADPAGNAGSVQTGIAEVDILRRPRGAAFDPLGGGLGCRVVTTTASERTGVTAGLLRLQAMVESATGRRQLLITRELWDRGLAATGKTRTLARSMMRYAWEMAERKRGGRSEDWSTHHIDALRYWCIGARWSAPAAVYMGETRRSSRFTPGMR